MKIEFLTIDIDLRHWLQINILSIEFNSLFHFVLSEKECWLQLFWLPIWQFWRTVPHTRTFWTGEGYATVYYQWNNEQEDWIDD